MDSTIVVIAACGAGLFASLAYCIRAGRESLRALHARAAAQDLRLELLQQAIDAGAPTPRADAFYEHMAPLLSQDPAKRRKTARTPMSARLGFDGLPREMAVHPPSTFPPIPLDSPILETERDHPLTRAMQLPAETGDEDATRVLDRPAPSAFAAPITPTKLSPSDPKPGK